MLSADISELMTTTISIYTFSSKNKFGEASYGTAVTTSALVLETLEQVIDKDNNKVDSKTKIFIDGNITVEYNSKISFNGLTPIIKSIKELPDDTGAIYTKIIYI